LSTTLITSQEFKKHDTGPSFPESPERLDAILSHLEKKELLDELQILEPTNKDKDNCLLVHDGDYILRVQQACDFGAPIIDTIDNPISKDSYDVALLAAGSMIQAVDNVFTGDSINAMVLTRPPGHHAERGQAMGFCLFNNVAIAARYAQKKYEIEKVSIIDFDVHHGNGTQHIFESDPSVMYVSSHQYPFYPGTGTSDEIGIGSGKGATINYPVKVNSGDDIIIDIYNNAITDKIAKFNPDLLIISAGFDAHVNDPIGGLTMTTEGYYLLSNTLVKLADEVCNGKLVSALEGGYDYKSLAESVEVHLLALLGK
jgi:acetoin utilization deacetylase AcuC-like enzyme